MSFDCLVWPPPFFLSLTTSSKKKRRRRRRIKMDDSTQSDADKIRAKRLAKLGGPSSATTPPAQNGGNSSSTTPPATTDGATDKASTPATRENPFNELAAQKEPEKKKEPVKITVAPKTTVEPSKPERTQSRPRERAAESFETWQDRILRQIFRVTLKPEEVKDSHGNKLIFLESTKDDLEQSNQPALLNVDMGDGILTEAAGHAPNGKIFEYFLQTFKRASRAVRGSRDPNDPKDAILKEAKRLSMSYCIFAVTMPEMFGGDDDLYANQSSSSDTLLDHMLVPDIEGDHGICTEFLTEAAARFEEDESIKEALVGAIEELSVRLSKSNMLADYQAYITAMRSLIRFPKIVDAFTQSPKWAPSDIEAQNIETTTLLGPFFRLSPMQQEVASNYFSAPKTRDRNFIASAQNAIRLTLRTHQEILFEIANSIVRTGAAPRERMLNWFALCVNKNHKKRAMRSDPRIVSSDGFMVNVTDTLTRLCEPFIDAQFGKIEKIDVDYLRRNPRVDISDETKINADQQTADNFYSHQAGGTSNFISEAFFLAVAAHHYGTEAAQTNIENIRRNIKYHEKELVAAEAERAKYLNQPAYLARYDEALNKMKKRIDDMWSFIHATQGVLLDDVSQARSMGLMRYVIVWVLRLASRQNLPKEKLQLPLPAEQPDVFKCLPEYFLEDIVDNFKFITANIPHIITPQQCEEIVQVCIAFLRSPEWVKNPGVKSGLVTILFYGVSPYYNHQRGVLGDVLIGSDFAHKNLLHALMSAYIEAERSGTHNQFYDKFNIRFEIFQVIKKIWVNTLYRENLAKEAKVNTDFFVQFVNMMVNDVTFVLDEALSSFVKINHLQKEVNDTALMQGLNEEQRKEKLELLEDTKGKAKSYMQLTNETMEALILFTETLADAFTMKEIVTRLADMLDYNLDSMVGPKSTELKVDNKEEYKFRPAQLLADILTVFQHLSHKETFVQAIARDGRSYKPANFTEAARIMRKTAMKSPDELRVWEELGKKVAEAKALEEQEEADLGEIPDEFMDPLVFDIMSDPVILPSSKNVIDRSTIRSHLLSDPTDPFNRVPLKIEEVIPDTELKAKIEAFKAEKKAERAAARAADAMDTTEG
ncbi:Ubiquitin conjugation factor E4 [Pseudocercospora fuligena]|uniref:Ubiquitin conjugation factor E4 n=1 Tax=Pseudocercospora fuligena TaxID=685502 RepID=A0A8H6VSY6_9PEZI|nr:Ubiquitin conjugation factor E4 [Pseudocercospora fuligena]